MSGTISLRLSTKLKVLGGSRSFLWDRKAQCLSNSTCSTSYLKLRFQLKSYPLTLSCQRNSPAWERKKDPATSTVASSLSPKVPEKSRRTWQCNRVFSWSLSSNSTIASSNCQKRTLSTTLQLRSVRCTNVVQTFCAYRLGQTQASHASLLQGGSLLESWLSHTVTLLMATQCTSMASILQASCPCKRHLNRGLPLQDSRIKQSASSRHSLTPPRLSRSLMRWKTTRAWRTSTKELQVRLEFWPDWINIRS